MELPSLLYKYTASATAEAILRTGRLRWSSPELFNDPAEFQRLPRFDPPLKESLNALPRILVDAALGRFQIDEARLFGLARQMYGMIKFGLAHGMQPEDFLEGAPDETRELDRMHSELIRSHFGTAFIRQARVMCLTANSSNPAMWANYAGNHSGCLLGFRHVPEENTPFTEAKSVSYISEPPVLCSGIDFYLYADKYTIGKRVIDVICYTKRIEWQYEQEWRAITWRTNEGDALFGDYPFLPRELESLTFGLKTTSEVQARLTALVASKYPECVIYRMDQEYGELRRCEA